MLAFIGHHLEKPSRQSNHVVLLLHAFPLSNEMWKPQLAALSEAGHSVLAPNVYGIGGSEPRTDWTMRHYAEALHELVTRFGFTSVSLIGVSMGGYQAFAFQRRYPDMVASMMLCDTRADADTDEARNRRFEFIEALKQNGISEAKARMIPKLLGKTTHAENPELAGQLSVIIERHRIEPVIEQLKALAHRPDSTSHLSSIHCPTLVVVGEEDELTPPALAKSMAEKIPNAQLEIIPKAGHLPNLEQPERFNELMLKHLQKLTFANA
ncbi:MAG: alpha/beta hydrolase [Chloroherpetonaceae bacterium]|nr:alpha/beta hydrolase [Chloroherpetonaceae bacterium]MDW8466025.1 alpha/beta hydrolase [Chloroherpetonaceae bacterium]